MEIKTDTPISELRGLTIKFLPKLKKLEIRTVRDLLYHFPYRYEDWSKIVDIKDLRAEEAGTIQGNIKSIEIRNSFRRRMTVTEALIADDTGEVKALWFNQPYIGKILRVGSRANFAGKLTEKNGEVYLSNPAYELVGQNETKHTARIVPIYPSTKGLTSKGIRFILKNILENLKRLDEFLPSQILDEYKLPGINSALRSVHFPENIGSVTAAKRRFIFEDLFLLQLRNLRQKVLLQKEKAAPAKFGVEDLEKVVKPIPFELTKSQKNATLEVLKDIATPRPMNRLLQGDVGSGKTIVAGIAAILSSETFQVAMMAPTEILARQHYKTITSVFKNYEGGVALLLSKECRAFYGKELETKVTKKTLLKDLERGNIKIVIGTHALIQNSVSFKNLGLVIIDEQHRFGVEQRSALVKTTGRVPHFLSMSATPIPRTLMITIFGDLDLSLINELPKGRKEIITRIVSPENREKAYAFIRGQVRKGDQVFIICPRIEPPKETDPETGEEIYKNTWSEKISIDAKNVKAEYERLVKKIFPDLRITMLHGKMQSDEKEKVMKDFADKKYDILVATSVIEVGVDVPNSTIIVIEGADRFGLSQLYQFRGRVGRGEKQSFCLLFPESNSEKTKNRLESLINAKNGFELAEYDLKMRGPGEFLGNTQTGLPDATMQALQNPELIKAARSAAERTLENDPDLKTHPKLLEKLEEFKESIHLE